MALGLEVEALSRCRKLVDLNLGGCHQIGLKRMEALAAVRPGLSFRKVQP